MVSDPNKGGLGANLVDFADGGAVRYSSAAGNIANSGPGEFIPCPRTTMSVSAVIPVGERLPT